MVRAAKEQDLPHILTIYNVARRYMRAHGNTAQWVNGYPSEELLRQDLAAGQLYVLEDGGGVYAVFAFILGEDPTYRRIVRGDGGLGGHAVRSPASGHTCGQRYHAAVHGAGGLCAVRRHPCGGRYAAAGL